MQVGLQLVALIFRGKRLLILRCGIEEIGLWVTLLGSKYYQSDKFW